MEEKYCQAPPMGSYSTEQFSPITLIRLQFSLLVLEEWLSHEALTTLHISAWQSWAMT
jgi:hypothetical protein